jgi:hypothetical protein
VHTAAVANRTFNARLNSLFHGLLRLLRWIDETASASSQALACRMPDELIGGMWPEEGCLNGGVMRG